jgi:hypothetical protein
MYTGGMFNTGLTGPGLIVINTMGLNRARIADRKAILC